MKISLRRIIFAFLALILVAALVSLCYFMPSLVCSVQEKNLSAKIEMYDTEQIKLDTEMIIQQRIKVAYNSDNGVKLSTGMQLSEEAVKGKVTDFMDLLYNIGLVIYGYEIKNVTPLLVTAGDDSASAIMWRCEVVDEGCNTSYDVIVDDTVWKVLAFRMNMNAPESELDGNSVINEELTPEPTSPDEYSYFKGTYNEYSDEEYLAWMNSKIIDYINCKYYFGYVFLDESKIAGEPCYVADGNYTDNYGNVYFEKLVASTTHKKLCFNLPF